MMTKTTNSSNYLSSLLPVHGIFNPIRLGSVTSSSPRILKVIFGRPDDSLRILSLFRSIKLRLPTTSINSTLGKTRLQR